MLNPAVLVVVALVSSMCSASHFRGGIIMVRPREGATSVNDVSLLLTKVLQ